MAATNNMFKKILLVVIFCFKLKNILYNDII